MTPDHFKTFSTDDFILDEDFRQIVRKSESGNEFKALLDNLPEKNDEINLAAQVLRGLHPKRIQQTTKRKQELWQQILEQQKRKIRIPYYLKIAATFLLLLGFGSTVYYLATQKQEVDVIVVNGNSPSDARLILADGKTVSISSKKSKIIYSSDGSSILVNDTSGITQSVSDNRLNQMTVPFGKSANITLSDGTRVWLNSGSKLVFPPAFRGKTRDVSLEGEAYFEVAANKEKPFFVTTDLFKMKVYGTKFNVQSYLQDKEYNIVLVEGKVSMNSIIDKQSIEVFLIPNQKATISRGGTKFEINSIENMEVYTAWIDGYLAFTNEKVSEVLKRVSRYYNVEIDTELPAKIEKIYGKLDLKDDLARVLDGIAFISKTKYTKQGGKYVFYEEKSE
jgi:transmembrane sensor